jgi:hypothetical protein
VTICASRILRPGEGVSRGDEVEKVSVVLKRKCNACSPILGDRADAVVELDPPLHPGARPVQYRVGRGNAA